MKFLSHPGAGWTIRRAQSGDRGDIEALFVDCLKAFPWRGSAPEELARMRRTILACEVFVAEEKGAGLVGFLTLETLNTYVPHIFVHEDWRFCGVGAGLLEVARDITAQPLRLDVDRMNTKAQAAYQAMGWTVVTPAGGRASDQIRLVGP